MEIRVYYNFLSLFSIAGTSTKREVKVKLVAMFLLSILSLATKNLSVAMITTNLRAS